MALDVSRSRRPRSADDVRFAPVPAPRLWEQRAVAPFDAGERALALGDDLAFRRMLLVSGSQAPRLHRFRPGAGDPSHRDHRGLESIVATTPIRASLPGLEPAWRPDVAAWNTSRRTGAQQPGPLRAPAGAIASFEQAIGLDPENDDAKYNLQLMLLRGSGLLPTEAAAGKNPLRGRQGSRGAGAGAPGSGYSRWT